jgi:hypothetical protein
MRAGQVETENRAILVRRQQLVNYNAVFEYFPDPNPDLDVNPDPPSPFPRDRDQDQD